MGPDHQPVNRQGPRGRRQPGMRTGLAARPGPGFANLGRALAAAGAGPRQVAKITIYVAGHRHEYLPAIRRRKSCSPSDGGRDRQVRPRVAGTDRRPPDHGTGPVRGQ
jgi:hypothetical protein